MTPCRGQGFCGDKCDACCTARPSACAPDREPRRHGWSRGLGSCSHRRQGLAAPASSGHGIGSDRHGCMLVTQSWQPCNHKHWQQQKEKRKKKSDSKRAIPRPQTMMGNTAGKCPKPEDPRRHCNRMAHQPQKSSWLLHLLPKNKVLISHLILTTDPEMEAWIDDVTAQGAPWRREGARIWGSALNCSGETERRICVDGDGVQCNHQAQGTGKWRVKM